MLHALEAPFTKTTLIAAAGALAAVAAFATLRHHHPHHCSHVALHRLVLHAPERANQLYLSAWMDGNDVRVELDRDRLQAFKFETRASISDGCRWLGTETLIPAGDHYAYTYNETLLSCEPDATPCTKTPRVGTVTIDF